MPATFKAAFAEAGYVVANQRQDWSAIREDGRVALTIWRDEIDRSVEPWLYGTLFRDPALWIDRPGNRLRISHLQQVEVSEDRTVDLILCDCVDPHAETRRVKSARHWVQRIGYLLPGTLDETSGRFVLELRPAAKSK